MRVKWQHFRLLSLFWWVKKTTQNINFCNSFIRWCCMKLNSIHSYHCSVLVIVIKKHILLCFVFISSCWVFVGSFFFRAQITRGCMLRENEREEKKIQVDIVMSRLSWSCWRNVNCCFNIYCMLKNMINTFSFLKHKTHSTNVDVEGEGREQTEEKW
jgi:hypothetical protein